MINYYGSKRDFITAVFLAKWSLRTWLHFDYFVNNKEKRVSNEKKDELNNEWVFDVYERLTLFMHCWIKLWESLKRVVTCALCINGFQKQLEILMEESSATRIDWIISRIENKILINKKHLTSSGNPSAGIWATGHCNSPDFFLFLVSSGHSQKKGLVDSDGCLTWPRRAVITDLFSLVETLGDQ